MSKQQPYSIPVAPRFIIEDWLKWGLLNDNTVNPNTVNTIERYLKRNAKILLESELELVLIQAGWDPDSDLGLIQVSGDPLHRYIADRLLEIRGAENLPMSDEDNKEEL